MFSTSDFSITVKLCLLCYISSLIEGAFDQQIRDGMVNCFVAKSCSLTHDAKIVEEDPCTYAKQGQCKVGCIVNSSDIGAFLESYVQLANYMCQHIKDMSNNVSCIASVRNEAADIKDCAGPYRTITKTLFTPFYLPSEQWCREAQSFRKCTKSAIEQTCGPAAALYHDIEIAAKMNEKIAQHLIDGSLKSWNPTGSGECELAMKPPLLESTTTRAVPQQSAAVPTIIEHSTVQTNATELMPSVNSTVENPDEDKPEDSTDDKEDDPASGSSFKSIQYIACILCTIFAICSFFMF